MIYYVLTEADSVVAEGTLESLSERLLVETEEDIVDYAEVANLSLYAYTIH